jgi:hypothetical protein
MTTKLIAALPFAGFYCSHHDAELDFTAERMLTDESGDAYTGLLDRLTYSCKWREVQQAYAAEYVAGLLSELGIEGTFESMTSPREYNFATDKVFATLELPQVLRLMDDTKPETLDKIAGERHTSRSGFISFYSPDWRTWGDVDSWDHNQLQTLIEAYIADTHGELDELELMDNARCNGRIESWIESATPDIGRLYTVADYLRTREARA